MSDEQKTVTMPEVDLTAIDETEIADLPLPEEYEQELEALRNERDEFRDRFMRALADADRSGARRIYLIGPDESVRGAARVRDLASGEEQEEPLP